MLFLKRNQGLLGRSSPIPLPQTSLFPRTAALASLGIKNENIAASRTWARPPVRRGAPDREAVTRSTTMGAGLSYGDESDVLGSGAPKRRAASRTLLG